MRYCYDRLYNAINQSFHLQLQQSLLPMTQLINITWKRKIETDAILFDIFDNPSQESVRTYQKNIGQIWEMFEVTRSGFTWKVYKNHEEIQDFILFYNIRFKSKLIFELFLTEGIRRVCQNPLVQNWPPFLSFVEIQDSEMGKIGSYMMQKKSGGRFKDYFCCRLPWQWQKRKFVIIKAGILYYGESSKQIKEYLPFSNSFKILCGRRETGYELGVKLEANHRKLLLFTTQCKVFCKFVYQVKEAIKKIEGPAQNPYESFAPTRKIQHLQFLIDGQKYFEAVYDALERAEWQIMICGWMISPEFQLKRPVDKYPDARFDAVLEKAAKNGVKIFILVYNQSSFLTNDSAYTKETLQKLSSNIKVLQHPLGVLPSFWSHHQKAVIIDQNEVLMGGLDICYGRYDTCEHRIDHNHPQWYPGIEYNNIRSKDLINVREFWKQSVARDVARLPWHDVSVHFSGEAVQDVCHHFIQYWNYASFQTHYEDRYLLILQKDRPKQPLMKRIKKGITSRLQSIRNLADELKQKLFSNGKKEQQEAEARVSEPSPLQIKSDDVKVEVQPKMMLELESDINAKIMLESKKSKTSKQSRESQLDSNRTYRSNRSNDFKEQMLAYQSQTSQSNFKHQKSKKTVSQLDQIVQNMQDQIEKIDYINDIRITNNNVSRLPVIQEEQQYGAGFSCQILRSVGSWSIGCSPQLRELSIHNAYLSLINSAEHFIYIQNQFFVSAIEGSIVIKNQIANALYERILTAFHNKQAFKVYVLLPLIPGFAGQLDDPEAVIPRVIMHWQYHTIARGENSLLRKLRKAGVHPDDYIIFLSLRAHGILEGIKKQPATEIVYLHSKLMIVDDKIAIIGSANINDRSMRGNRDSQLCVLVQGRRTVRSIINNEQFYVNKTIQNLRLDLWKQHFGSDLNYVDPLSVDCLNSIKKRAKHNTIMYREVFHCYPDDQVNKLIKLMQWRKPINESLYHNCFNAVKGFVVEFPLQFLKDEDLLIGSTLYPDILSV